MNEEAPDSKEVAHFHFNQLRTLKIAKGNEEAPKECLNVIASASKYGLLFVGISNGFKVLKLENILDLDEDKENKSVEENFYSQVVNSETPTSLSLSADQKTLAVCVKRGVNMFADMYDIAAFADPEEKPQPFQNVLLSGTNSKLMDFVWNPVMDGMYAFCMSDGSVCIHDLTGMKLTIVATLPNVGATAACWSPKGKQIVIGKRDGSFAQYKPTLQEVKSIPPPSGEKYSVANICWISTAQFAVLYVPEGQNVSPCLFIVSTPKNAPVVYMNFYDICLGNASSSDQRYFLHHESAWGVLVCASTDSIEVAVLGDSPSWVQWEIRDDCRALLPAKNGSKNAIAMGVMYCSQRSIVISETEVYPPMPIVFYLTDNGLLVSYHLVNSAPGSVSLVRPSTPIDRENERKRPGGNQSVSLPPPSSSLPFITQAVSIAAPAAVSPPVFQSPPPITASVPLIQPTAPPAFGFGQSTAFPRSEPQPPPFGAVPFFQNVSSTPKAPSSSISLFKTPATPVVPLESERFHKTSKGMSVTTPTPVNKDTPGVRHVAVAQRSIGGTKPEFEKDAHIAETVSSLKPPQLQGPMAGAGDSNVIQKDIASNQYTYLTAIFDEIQNFEKEIQELKKSSDLTSIGSKEEMASLMSSTLKLQEFQNGMSETMVSLNNDIHSLKNVLLESFVMVEEANSKEKRKNDHSYVAMLKDRALDPMTAKRMQTMEQHYMYVSTQLQEVRNKLDLDWFEFLEKKKDNWKSTNRISSAEAIYKTIVNNQNSIHNLQNSIDKLSKKATEKKLDGIYKRRNKSQFIKRSDSEELSKLADAFLQTKIASTEEEKPQFQRKMSSDAQNVLKKFLSSSTVTSVRPTILNSTSQSRFLSKSSLYAEQQDSNKTQASVPSNEQPIVVQPRLDKSSPNLKPSSVMKPVITNQPPMLIPSNNLETFTNENKTPISKPRVTSAIEFEKLRLQNRAPTSSENANVDQFKGSMNKSTPKFTTSTLSFAPPKPVTSVSPAGEIESPLYEDITPPDSPDLSKYIQNMPETNTIQASFKQIAPEIPQRSVMGKKGFSSENEKFQVLQDSKQQTPFSRMFPPPSNPPENDFTPFSLPSSLMPAAAKLSTSGSSTDIPKSESEKTKAPENVFKPAFGKPATTSTFTFFQPTSSVSFPNFSSTSSFFTVPAKKDEAKPASNLTKTPLDASDKAPVNPTFGTDQNKESASSLFSSQKSIFSGSEKKVEGFGFTQPVPVSASSSTVAPTTTGTDTPSFFSKPPTVTKELTFFQPTAVSTPAPSQFSFSSEPTKDASKSLQTEKTVEEPTPEPAETSPADTSDKQASVPSHPTPSQAPVDLSQNVEAPVTSADTPASPVGTTEEVPAAALKAATAVLSSMFAAPAQSATVPTTSSGQSLASPDQSSTSTTTTDQVIPPVTTVPSSETTGTVKPAGLVFSQSSFTTPVTSTPATSTPTQASATTTTTSVSVFGQPPAVTSPQTSEPTTSTVTSSFFGGVPSTTSVFGQTMAQTPTTPLFSSPVLGAAAAPSGFGQAPGMTSSFFDQSTTKSSFFGKTDTPVFGQSSTFGSTATTTSAGSFPQASGTFFSQPTVQNSVFGASPANSTGSSGFGTQPDAAKSPFGQTQGSFGLAKSVFGQQSNTTPAVFGQPASPASNTFGQTSGTGAFGQGSFFSGLGGKPSTENASKNVFAVGNIATQPSEPSTVFGATAFGAKTGGSFTGGSFSSGGGSVAQTGFGAFRQQTPQKTGGFGAAPSFSGGPSFGGSPAFGSPPSFGSGCSLGAVFGSSTQSAQTANFSSFASASSPTFGSLASQSPGGFGTSQQNQQQPAFGQASPFATGPVFGSAPAFGGQQPSSFGSPSGTTGNSSAFTQWRN